MSATERLSKAAKKAFCQRILAGRVGPVVEEARNFLLTEVFPLHPDWALKAGSGVSDVEVRAHGVYKTRGFFLIRTDGSAVDISYKVALDGRTSTGKFTSAARSEILPQISAFRRDNPPPAEGWHVDHIEPFDAILREWLAVVDLQIDDVILTSQLVGHHDLFASRDLAKSWQRYHGRRAAYRWLPAAENIAKSNKVEPTVSSKAGLNDDWLQDYETEEKKRAA